MQKEYLIELSDAVIAVKDANGRIKLNQLLNTTAVGAVSGTFWGALIGLIFLLPLAGAAIGAAWISPSRSMRASICAIGGCSILAKRARSRCVLARPS
jgi:uncharacterized membrane protein